MSHLGSSKIFQALFEIFLFYFNNITTEWRINSFSLYTYTYNIINSDVNILLHVSMILIIFAL